MEKSAKGSKQQLKKIKGKRSSIRNRLSTRTYDSNIVYAIERRRKTHSENALCHG